MKERQYNTPLKARGSELRPTDDCEGELSLSCWWSCGNSTLQKREWCKCCYSASIGAPGFLHFTSVYCHSSLNPSRWMCGVCNLEGKRLQSCVRLQIQLRPIFLIPGVNCRFHSHTVNMLHLLPKRLCSEKDHPVRHEPTVQSVIFFHPTWSCCDLQPQWSSFQRLSLAVCVSCTWNSALNGFKNKGRSHGLRQWFSTWLINPWFCNPSDSQSGIFRQPGLSSGGVSCLTAGFWTRCDLGD